MNTWEIGLNLTVKKSVNLRDSTSRKSAVLLKIGKPKKKVDLPRASTAMSFLQGFLSLIAIGWLAKSLDNGIIITLVPDTGLYGERERELSGTDD